MADFYEALGVSKNATPEEIKRAYRKLAHEHHPDKGGGDDKKFKDINQAYQVLSDPEKRQQYDQFGASFESAGQGGFGGDPFGDFSRGFGGFSSWQQGAGANGFDFGDIFSEIFGFSGNSGATARGGNRRGIDLETRLKISFLEAVFGAEKEISVQRNDSCPACGGSGAETGTKQKTCSTCHGQGQIRKVLLGAIATSATCPTCQGTGKIPENPCSSCAGKGYKQQVKTIRVIVPPGIDDDQKIRLSGQGEAGYRGSRSGDLYIRISIITHPTLSRDGFDILSELPISFYQAALGTRMDIETVDGQVELKIPAGIQSGKILRLRGKGVPHISTKKRGDHLVTVRVVTPTKLSKKEKEFLHRLAEEKGELVDIEESVWKKIKNQFE